MAAYNDRVLALGFTGSGKSEVLNVMFSELRCQKVLLDTKHEFEILDDDGQRLRPARSVEEIDWTQPVIHYRDRTGQVAEFGELFDACFRRPNGLVICAHELADVCEESPGRTPREVNGYLAKGRAKGKGLLGGSQRPVNMPKRCLTEANEFYLFVPALSADDHDFVARNMGIDKHRLRMIIDHAHAELGDYTYLRFVRRGQQLEVVEPLPEHIRGRNIVTRTMDA